MELQVSRRGQVSLSKRQRFSSAASGRVLLERGVDGYRAYVCEDLGQESEKIVAADLPSLRGMQFSKLNTLVLPKETSDETRAPAFGIPDEESSRRRSQQGLITKLEIRAVSLAKMRLGEDSVGISALTPVFVIAGTAEGQNEKT